MNDKWRGGESALSDSRLQQLHTPIHEYPVESAAVLSSIRETGHKNISMLPACTRKNSSHGNPSLYKRRTKIEIMEVLFVDILSL